jgi:hypothetical protein
MVGAPFRSLDFVYVPSADVAVVELTDGPPGVLLADHLEGERPILVYRVDDVEASLAALEARGSAREATFEIPRPCCSFTLDVGHRVAPYQPTRPDVAAHFEGRADF